MATKDKDTVVIHPANIQRATIQIKGTAPLVQNKFSKKAKDKMMEDMSKTKAQKGKKSDRPPRDYDADFENAQHTSVAGWNGVPCPAFRSAMIRACSLIKGVTMTDARMAVFVLADGFDKDDGTPLVKLKADKPERLESLVRLQGMGNPADVRIRPMWREWEADLTVEFDADTITAESVVNLLDRAGRQVGVGEGRPFSKNSNGQGWGTFSVVSHSFEETSNV